MIRIGIIGAENSHCAHIARLCNVENRVDARVVAVWGETPEAAAKAAEGGKISAVVADWREMLGQIDGVMIDHRHAKFHAEPAQFFIENRVPTFVDKPFTYTLREARTLCALARRKKTPVTSFSVIAQEDSFRQLCEEAAGLGQLASFSTIGPADIEETQGGIFFYGIHQVEAVVEMLGFDIERIQAVRHGRECVAVLHYRNGPMACIQMVNNGNYTFHWTAVGEKTVVARDHERDAVPYLGGLRIFLDMFKTHCEPFPHDRLLAPVAILESIDKSLKLKRAVPMPKL